MLAFFNKKSKDVILSCDGKLIRRALTESSGDVDLQGAEHGPSLIERENILKQYKIFKKRICDLNQKQDSNSELIRINQHLLYSTHECDENWIEIIDKNMAVSKTNQMSTFVYRR